MPWNLLSADDIFISYSRKDATTYALGLADALTKEGFSCFFDRLGTDASQSLPRSLIRKLKACTMLVVVGTPAAGASAAVAQEIAEFSQANGTSRIVLIDFGGAIQLAEWRPRVVGKTEEKERVEALTDGNPSPSVVKLVEKSFNYTRSKQRLRRYTVLAATLLAVSVIASVAAFIFATDQVAKAATATEEARKQTQIADDERKRAESESAAATKAKDEATQAKDEAAAAGKEAERQAKLAGQAEDKRAEAEGKAQAALRRQEVAEAREREATANAALQEKIGASQRLASQGARQFDHQLDLGLVLNAEALRVHDTYEARNGLLSALQHSPRLLAHLDLGLRDAPGIALIDALLSSDEKIFAARNAEGVTLWDVASGEKILNIARKNIFSFAISPNGKLLALGSHKKLFLWDLAARRELPEIEAPDGSSVYELTFDPSGKYLAFKGGIITAVFVVETARPSAPTKMGGEQYGLLPQGLAFSPDGKMLAAAGTGVMVWDVETKAAQIVWPRPKQNDYANFDHVTFSPDGKTLVTAGSYRKKIVTWDVAERKQLRQFDLDSGVSSVAFNRKGDLLAFGCGDGTIRLWDAGSMEEVERLSAGRTSRVARLVFTNDDQKLISVAEEVLVWDMSDDQHLSKVPGGHHGGILSAAFSPDGKYLVSSDAHGDPVALRDARSGEALGQPFSKAAGAVRNLSFSRDGRLLAMLTSEASSGDTVVQMWDFRETRLINTPYRSAEGYVSKIALSPDGGLLALGSFNLSFRETTSGRQRGATVELPRSDYVTSMAFSPDGNLLAFGTSVGNIFLLETRTFQQVGQMSIIAKSPSENVTALAFSPDGKTLVSNSSRRGSVLLWDVASRGQLRELVYPGLRTQVKAVAFSADGKMLAMAGDPLDGGSSKEHPIVLWDAETQQPLGQPLTGHTAPIYHLAFSPNCDGCPDARLVSGGTDGTLRLWDVSVASWQKRACRMTNRRLTDEERGFYFKDPSHREFCSDSLSFAALTAPPAATGRTPLSRRVEKPAPRRYDAEEDARADYDDGGEGQVETVETKLRRIVIEHLGLKTEDILPGYRLAEDLGAGESEKAVLYKAIKDEFGVDIPAEDAKKIVNFRDLLTDVERRVNAGGKPK